MTALLSFTRLMSFIHREYGVEKVNDIRLDVYIFIGLGALYSTDRSDTKSFDSHAVLFILINFSLAAYCEVFAVFALKHWFSSLTKTILCQFVIFNAYFTKKF